MHFHDDPKMIFTYLQSQQTAQNFLLECYKQLHDVDAERKSYENCNVFMYCLNHGMEYYRAGEKVDIVLKPVMYFYGMAHLLKACLLIKRPDYPESTSVLAHGVSTRKRKKKDYNFLEDEVKVQYKGLFPYFSEHLFRINKLPFEKITMNDLLRLIPELIPYYDIEQNTSLVKVGKVGENILSIPTLLCDHYHMTENALLKKLNAYVPTIVESRQKAENVIVVLGDALSYTISPFQVDMKENIYLPTDREMFFPISEVMVHYLLLYNLSMLSRYEAEWWGELLATKPDKDYPFISSFLDITQVKIPMIISKFLIKNMTGHN
ncbi:YaaC family protein [Ornithinibacillus scapharcae]|uniref:YaaC family protein n=1 Tax=Ornithinibacillus scapharcae TaxID=1147159 RepID=UPI000225B5BA|nr:YaaC family protein [Ornithinibacillus scapharcae]